MPVTSIHSETADATFDIDSRATPVHLLLYWEARQPEAVYMTQPLANDEVAHYTWRDVADQARRMASYLQALGLPPRSHIALYGKNSAHWIMADLAIWMAGYVSVPIYPTANAETAAYVLQHSEAKALFVGKLDGMNDSWLQVKDIIPADLPCIRLPLAPAYDGPQWQDLVTKTSPLEIKTLSEPEDLATIVYTSGSTGLPKGVMHNFATMLQVAHSVEGQWKFDRRERMLSYLPLAHVAERVLVETVSLFIGCHVFFTHDLQSFPADLRRARPTFFFSVPRLWTKFYQGVNEKIPPAAQRVLLRLPLVNRIVRKRILEKLGLQDVRVATTGSAPLPVAILEWYRKLGLELLEGYAMTENCGYSHVNSPGDNRPGYVGYTQPGVECRISAEGEVQVKSPGNMLGYYKNPEKTAEDLLPDGFLRTGDTGEIDEQGRLKLTGRVKDIFKTPKGKYVAPVPIEQKLGEHPSIEMVYVGGTCLAQPVGLLFLAEKMRLELAKNTDKSRIQKELEQLLETVNKDLEMHEKLAFLVVLNEPWTMESGLLTPTMKIRRQAIETYYAAKFMAWAAMQKSVVWN
jgi:long-subunit acyl-CoA synthetase (AMP-forming)